MRTRRWHPVDRLIGGWIRRIPEAKRMRVARILGVVKWSVLAGMAGLVLWQQFGTPADGSPGPVRTELAEAEASAASALAASIKQTWNLEVRYQGDTSKFVLLVDHIPDGWRLDPIAAPDVLPALRAVSAALSVYPTDFIRQHAGSEVGPIFLVRSIWVNGSEVGGMFMAGAIYVPARGMDASASVTFAEDTVHHEFALVGLYAGPSPKAAWAAANAPGFAYQTDHDAEAVRVAGHRPDATDTSDGVHDAGFMIKYAESSLEEDWQTYAEQAFGHPEALVALVKRFPRVKAKTKIFIDHYGTLDPAFAAYFARTGLEAAVG